MLPYSGRFAELYELFYQDKPYLDEAVFVRDLLWRHQGPAPIQSILELACGTGINAIHLANMGFSVLATDLSEDMLARARAKGAPVDFRLQDMASLDLPERPFDAAVCLFDSLGYLRTNAAILAALERVRAHLRPRGLFVCEFWHAAAMLLHYEPTRVRRWKSPLGDVIRISETTLDTRSSLAQVRYTIFDPRATGGYELVNETHTNRFFSCEEIRALSNQVGFDLVSVHPGFSFEGKITSDTWHLLALLQAR